VCGATLGRGNPLALLKLKERGWTLGVIVAGLEGFIAICLCGWFVLSVVFSGILSISHISDDGQLLAPVTEEAGIQPDDPPAVAIRPTPTRQAIPRSALRVTPTLTVTSTPVPTATSWPSPTATQVPTDAPAVTTAPDMPTMTATPTDTPTSPAFTSAPTEVPVEEGQVVDVIDGDTIRVLLRGREYQVRYLGIDAPDLEQPMGDAARRINVELVTGKTIRLENDISDADGDGRLLRYVWVDDVMVNAILIQLGHAQVFTHSLDVRYQDRFVALQREAEVAGRGLWARTATATRGANLRSGPGTNYAMIGQVKAGDVLNIVARNAAGDWYELANGAWIAAFLVANAPTGVPVTTILPSPSPTRPLRTATPTREPEAGPGNVQIVSVNFDGVVRRVESDEYVVVENHGGTAVAVGGWRLNAGYNGQDFVFPGGFVLQPGQTCRIYTNEFHPESCGLTFGIGKAIWDNKGDCGYLFNREGQLVSQYCY
jgi:endonuclease YncB( thermonuclease family)